MKRIVYFLFISLFTVYFGQVRETSKLFMDYPYIALTGKLDVKLQLYDNAKEIITFDEINYLEDYAKTLLRARIGKPLNKVQDNIYAKERNIYINLFLRGPYNDDLDIYFGNIELLIFSDDLYSKDYRVIYPLANSKKFMYSTVKKYIEYCIDYFISDFFKIIDFDYKKLDLYDKINFIYKYPSSYSHIQRNLWNEIGHKIKNIDTVYKYLEYMLQENLQTDNFFIINKKTKSKLENLLNFQGYGIYFEENNIYLMPYSKVHLDSLTTIIGSYLYQDKDKNGKIDYIFYTTYYNSILQKFYFPQDNIIYYYDVIKPIDIEQELYKEILQEALNKKSSSFATGTGFFISKNGHFLTNYHVIKDANKITVNYNNDKYEANILAWDVVNDLALLKIDRKTKKFIPICDNYEIYKGEKVFTLGFPMVNLQGKEAKVTFGNINSLSGIENDIRYLQVDVPIQPGNSGSPLLNFNGELIGIITSTLNQNIVLKENRTIAQNVNYAIKTDYVIPLLKQNSIKVISNCKKKKYSEKEIIKKFEEAVILIFVE